MDLVSVEIRNFKGINDVKFDLIKSPYNNVNTLVGVNESGKTTILEAINFFEYNDETDILDTKINFDDIIPIKEKTNFNDSIFIKFTLLLDDADLNELRAYMLDKHEYVLTSSPDKLVVTQEYQYKSSKYIPVPFSWNIDLKVKQKKWRNPRQLHVHDEPVWQKATNFLKTKMPKILYFPTALFELPDRICLSDNPEDEKEYFFKLIIQDILDSMGRDLSIDEHIVNRMNTENQKLIRQLSLEMGRKINEVILDEWTEVLNSVKYKIIVDIYEDDGETFLEFNVENVDGIYRLSERSLGFRWFFVFLLLTQFRGFRRNENRHIIFMFDEPAANLSNKAQKQLLKSLERISDKCSIIYTTHSHHLINPSWLEGAHVVTNAALENGDMESFCSQNTNITLHKYRNYVSNYPQNVSYFQPILDILEYVPNELDMAMPSVIVEGKNDFYTLKYFFDVQMELGNVYIVPGMSCSNVDTLISLFYSWGKDFILLLDSDVEARNNKNRYYEMFGGMVEGRIYTLADIDSTWKTSMEAILTSSQKLTIQKSVFKSKRYSKKLFNKSMQELLMTKNKIVLEDNCIASFKKIHDFIKQKL